MKKINKNKYHNIKKYILLFFSVVIGSFLVVSLILFVFSRKFINDHKNESLEFGVSFSARQAEKFRLNPNEALEALLDDAGFRRFRLMSYWSDIEKNKGKYDYTELDSQIEKIAKRDGRVTLAIGLRQPRWPECFAPNWTDNLEIKEYTSELYGFIKNTVERYKNNKTVVSWQLENEFHLDAFGECQDHSRRRLIEETKLVKATDSMKPVILSLANNYFGFPLGDPRPDIFGVSVYTRVFEGRILNNYFTYPFPSWYYSGRAGVTELFTKRSSFIHELQLEPWGPRDINEMSITEQDKSMNTKRIKKQLKFAENTGMRTIDLWGGEWWYWRKTTLNDPGPWQAVKEHTANASNR